VLEVHARAETTETAAGHLQGLGVAVERDQATIGCGPFEDRLGVAAVAQCGVDHEAPGRGVQQLEALGEQDRAMEVGGAHTRTGSASARSPHLLGDPHSPRWSPPDLQRCRRQRPLPPVIDRGEESRESSGCLRSA
jgi:hypothetical protein